MKLPKYKAWDKGQECWIKIGALNFDEDGEMWYLAPSMDGFKPVYYENELGKHGSFFRQLVKLTKMVLRFPRDMLLLRILELLKFQQGKAELKRLLE